MVRLTKSCERSRQVLRAATDMSFSSKFWPCKTLAATRDVKLREISENLLRAEGRIDFGVSAIVSFEISPLSASCETFGSGVCDDKLRSRPTDAGGCVDKVETIGY